MTASPAAASSRTLRAVGAPDDELERRYATDAWQARELGIQAARGRGAVSFVGIAQPWLREAAKRWARQRLNVGCAFNTIAAAALAFKRFSGFLASCQPPIEHPEQVDPTVLERYLAWLAPQPLAESTKTLSRMFLRAFLEENRRHRWLPQLPAQAVVYSDELHCRRVSLPRFIPEVVMAQMESEANLEQLRPPYRNLVVLLTETGLRSGDACALPLNPVVPDSADWPCLRFVSSKMRTEHLLPLSPRAIDAIRAQQRFVSQTWPQATAWLFPSRSDPQQPLPYETFLRAFGAWQRRIGLHDESGRSIRVTPHQLRHTLGTRLINAGVPQHVVQRLLGHASPAMTAVYGLW